jgi:hypothetical protein
MGLIKRGATAPQVRDHRRRALVLSKPKQNKKGNKKQEVAAKLKLQNNLKWFEVC